MTLTKSVSYVGAYFFKAINRGRNENHGLELELRWNDKIGRNFNLRGAFNMCF